MKTPHSHMAPGTEGLAGIWVEGRCSLHGPRAPGTAGALESHPTHIPLEGRPHVQHGGRGEPDQLTGQAGGRTAGH